MAREVIDGNGGGMVLPKSLTWGAFFTILTLLAGAYGYSIRLETRITQLENNVVDMRESFQEYQRETTQTLKRVERITCRLCMASKARCPYCEE